LRPFKTATRLGLEGVAAYPLFADCNLGGVYTLRGKEISIEITYTTRAACPPESRELDYIRDLNAAARYFVQDKILQIELKVDTGTMRFTR
jgi:heat shock protein HslJ